MRKHICVALALVLSLAATPLAALDQRSEAEQHVEFGIELARKDLWREASQRFQQATKIDASYGAAWNNLGVAYEQLGQFNEARLAYEKALDIEPDNTFFRNNYDLFREIYDRQNRRRDR